MDRTAILLATRPTITIEESANCNESERFQNNVLRPILKLQHDLLCFSLLESPLIKKQNFKIKHKDQQKAIIINNLKTNTKLKSFVVHSITSMMTIDELKQYHSNTSEYKKRIISMATHRLIDGLISC